jgi:hypothetical protein
MSSTTRRHRQHNHEYQSVAEPQLSNTIHVPGDTCTTRIPAEIIDSIIDFLHSDIHALGMCSLVCKSWLPASRYHLFHVVTIGAHNSNKFQQLLRYRPSTWRKVVVHFVIGTVESSLSFPPKADPPFFTPRAKLINFIPRLPALRSLKMTRVILKRYPQFSAWRSMDGFKTLTVIEMVFVQFTTCCTLLEILAAFSSLERLKLSEIRWNSIGNIPPPPTFLHLRSLTANCKDNSEILNWLSEGPLPALRELSICAASTPCNRLLRTAGGSLQHLEVTLSVHHPHLQNESESSVSFPYS